jgi:hypothetical protein
MVGTPLPDDIRGQWIWHSDSHDRIDSYAFLRHHFALFETPRSAELWVAASFNFQLYVNGRHFCCGSMAGTHGSQYYAYFDVGYCLQVGNNVIGVIAHHADIPTYSQHQKDRGFWCQLNLDDLPYVWTNEDWRTYSNQCYVSNQPRISRATTFVETIDFKRYPIGWRELDFNDEYWDEASTLRPLDTENMVPFPDFEPISDIVPFSQVLLKGKASQRHLTTHVSFAHAVKNPNGLFAAETWIHSNDQAIIPIYLFCDDPYHFFVNNVPVRAQARKEARDWADPRWETPRCYQQEEVIDVVAEITLEAGWNQVMIAQQVGPDSAGATLVFPANYENEFKFQRSPDAFGLPGWNIAGPLRIPFPKITSPVFLEDMPRTSYYKLNPCDAAAHLLSYRFDASEAGNEQPDFLDLGNGEFVVLELPHYARGYVEALLSGSSGDVIDFVYGNLLQGNVVSPYDGGVRKIFTTTLSGQPVRWQSIASHGMRYLMVIVRHATSRVTIQDVGVRKLSKHFNEPNSFACSDELMNQLWEIGATTFDCTYDFVFLNSADFLEGQLLADAMIQSVGSFAILGNFDLSAKALREFAASQFETGEIPALAPSEFHVSLFDFSLLWPLWLQKHVMYSGDLDILEELLPNLRKLLSFFDAIAGSETMLLGALAPPYRTPCLIDYDETIDKEGISTCLNALYCNALLKAEWLYNQVGRGEEATECHQRAARIAHNLRKLTWNEERGLFCDGWCEGEQSTSYSMQANVLALYAGIAPAHNTIFENLFFDYAPFQEMITDRLNENPYFKFFVLETAFTLGKRNWAVEYMRYYWGRMIQSGANTWWNKFCPDIEFEQENIQSLCHGYGISPNYFLMREIVGIRPVSPGAKRVYFSPELTAAEWVRAKMRTPHGSFKIEWSYLDTGELQIVIDTDYPLEVVPQLDPNVAENAILHVSDDVSIIDLSTLPP